MDFVWNNFFDENTVQFGLQHVVIREKTPLYFQRNGHSRIIIVVQAKHQQDGALTYNLLDLDPAHSTSALERSLKKKLGWQELIRKGTNTLKKPQYQLCYVDPKTAMVLLLAHVIARNDEIIASSVVKIMFSEKEIKVVVGS